MEMDSLTCHTELLRGQLGNIVRVFVNPRQDKLANLLPSGVGWRSHRLRFLLLFPYVGSLRDIVKVMFTLVKFIMGIVKCSSFHRPSFLSRLIMELVKSIFATIKASPGARVRQSRFQALAVYSRLATSASSGHRSQYSRSPWNLARLVGEETGHPTWCHLRGEHEMKWTVRGLGRDDPALRQLRDSVTTIASTQTKYLRHVPARYFSPMEDGIKQQASFRIDSL